MRLGRHNSLRRGDLAWGWRVAAVGFLALLPALGWSQVTATLDRDVVPVGETVTLTLTFEGAAPEAVPVLPTLPKLQPGSVGQSQQVQIVNGRVRSQKIYQYTLVPTEPGEVVIPSLQVVAGSTVMRTQPLRLRITPGQGLGSSGEATNQLAFLRLVVPKSEVYVGEAFPVEIHLYWQDGKDIRTPQLKAEGFSLNQGKEPNYTESRTRVGNVVYRLLIFRMAATAARAGELELGPATCDLTLLIPVARSGPRRDPFFDFDPLGVFGARVQSRPVTLASEAQPMKVLPLPAQNVPETFNGAVGQFDLVVTAGPTNVAVGDPITVRARITGQGLLDALSLPVQPLWRDFKAYPPTAKVESADPLGLSGSKLFEQVLIPQNHEIAMLPPLVFSYFDSVQRAYRVLSNAPIALAVGHAAQTGTPLPALTNATDRAAPEPDDIIHIKPRLEELMAWQRPLVLRPWFVGLQALPVLAWAGLFLRRRQREALASNPRLRRQREVARKVREGLKELRSRAEAREAEAFFATLFRLLQEQLGERLDLPASAITESVIDERLRGGQLGEAVLGELHGLFGACNQARYAPDHGLSELTNLVPRVENVLRELQGVKG